jgi:hypothetical protein
MNPFWDLAAYSVLLAMALWFCLRIGKDAVRSVGIYRFSRVVANGQEAQAHLLVCDDPKCPATALISAIDDTHREVRTEAIVAVGESLVALAAVAYTFVFFMGRLV